MCVWIVFWAFVRPRRHFLFLGCSGGCDACDGHGTSWRSHARRRHGQGVTLATLIASKVEKTHRFKSQENSPKNRGNATKSSQPAMPNDSAQKDVPMLVVTHPKDEQDEKKLKPAQEPDTLIRHLCRLPKDAGYITQDGFVGHWKLNWFYHCPPAHHGDPEAIEMEAGNLSISEGDDDKTILATLTDWTRFDVDLFKLRYHEGIRECQYEYKLRFKPGVEEVEGGVGGLPKSGKGAMYLAEGMDEVVIILAETVAYRGTRIGAAYSNV